MKYNFTGKVALITGSSSGIGAAIATQLAEYGAQVTIHGRDAANLAKVAEKIEAATRGRVKPLQIVGDLQDEALPGKLVDETVAKFGRLDFLVNNAGGTAPGGKLESPNLLSEFDSIFRVNVRAVVQLTQLAVPHLEKSQGNIVNISSVVSVKPWTLPYSASKAALDMVTKTSALELGAKGVRVNSVNPGAVETAFNRGMGMNQVAYDGMLKYVLENSLLKRVGQPEDIANLTSFLLSDDARNITGSFFFSDTGSQLK